MIPVNALLLVSLLLAATSRANFINDPKCEAARPRAPSQCRGQRSNCWSPGVRDTDCPGHGLCCYDGCANTCVVSSPPPRQPPPPPPPPPPRRTTRKPVAIPPPVSYIPLPPEAPAGLYQPPPAEPPVGLYEPPPAVTPPPPAPPVLPLPSNQIQIRNCQLSTVINFSLILTVPVSRLTGHSARETLKIEKCGFVEIKKYFYFLY